MIPVKNNWGPILQEISKSPQYQELREFLKEEYANYSIFPPKEDLWMAFEWTDYREVKVVILGQDPYHGPGQAHGLSFSVQPGAKIPPSLRNIYKELQNDLGYAPPKHGYLKAWAEQGVLLLNTVLSVRAGEPNSHQGRGWELVTDAAIRALNQLDHLVVFVLWGRNAQAKARLIDAEKHVVIESSHPSPLSARHSFLGSRVFSRTNEFLVESGQKPIDWELGD